MLARVGYPIDFVVGSVGVWGGLRGEGSGDLQKRKIYRGRKGIYKRENREIRKICESGELRGC